jgi:hypothetical protein
VRPRLATLVLAALLALAAGAAPALATPGSGSSLHASVEPGPSGNQGSGGPGSGEDHGSDRSGSSGSGAGQDHGYGGSHHEQGDDHGAARTPAPNSTSPAGLAGGPKRAPAAAPPAPELASAPPTASAAPEPAPPVGSVADRQAGFPRLSTAPAVAVAAVVGGALLLAAMVAAAFRARARLGRLG